MIIINEHLNILISGTHTFKTESDWRLDWKISPTKSIQDKDVRTTSFEITDEGKYVVPLNGKPVEYGEI